VELVTIRLAVTNATVAVDTMENNAKMTLMNVRIALALTVELVTIRLAVTNATVAVDTMENNAKMTSMSARQTILVKMAVPARTQSEDSSVLV